jgi:hypothetical protein
MSGNRWMVSKARPEPHAENPACPTHTACHPVAVLDPENYADQLRLAEAIRHFVDSGYPIGGVERILRSLAAPPAPPKPAEPTGLGAIVEDAQGSLWHRVDPSDLSLAWCRVHPRFSWGGWHEIDAVAVLSEGVTE